MPIARYSLNQAIDLNYFPYGRPSCRNPGTGKVAFTGSAGAGKRITCFSVAAGDLDRRDPIFLEPS
jgi:hypothetical protein